MAAQILVYWQDRVLESYQFSSPEKVSFGWGDKCNIKLPPLLGVPQAAKLNFGEALEFEGGLLRLVFENQLAPNRPLRENFFDFGETENYGVLLALLISLLWAFYFQFAGHRSLEFTKVKEEPLRKARIAFRKVKRIKIKTPTPQTPKAPRPTMRRAPKNSKNFGLLAAVHRSKNSSASAPGLLEKANQARGEGSLSGQRNGPSYLATRGDGSKGEALVAIGGPNTNSDNHSLGGPTRIGQRQSAALKIGGPEEKYFAGMDREAIRRVILANKRAIRHCYDRELQKSKDLYGKLVLQWDITEGGRVRRAKVLNDGLKNRAVSSCLLKKLRGLQFPEPPEDQTGRVIYPFVFVSQ